MKIDALSFPKNIKFLKYFRAPYMNVRQVLYEINGITSFSFKCSWGFVGI